MQTEQTAAPLWLALTRLSGKKTFRTRDLITAFMALVTSICFTVPTLAQNSQAQNGLNDKIARYHQQGLMRAYQCAGPGGEYSEMTHHPDYLRSIALKLSQTETFKAELALAKQSNCRHMVAGKYTQWYAEKSLSPPVRIGNATWLVVHLTQSDPGATGYNFEAIVRLDMGERPTTQGIVASDHRARSQADVEDAKFYELFNSRTISGSDDNGGYLRCPTRDAVTAAIAAAGRASPGGRDAAITSELRKRACVVGRRPITGLHAYAHTRSTDINWYAVTAKDANKPIEAVIWFY